MQSALAAVDMVEKESSVEATFTKFEDAYKGAGDKRKMLVSKQQW